MPPPPPPPSWDAERLGAQNAGYIPTAPGLAPGMKGYVPPAAAPPPPGMFVNTAGTPRKGECCCAVRCGGSEAEWNREREGSSAALSLSLSLSLSVRVCRCLSRCKAPDAVGG